MVDRPTIADLAKKAGVSVATVDRVLNRRLPVREDTAIRVVEAAESIGYHATGLLKRRLTETPRLKFAFLLQKRDDFYTQLGNQLAQYTKSASDIEGKPYVEFIDELAPPLLAKRITEAAQKFDAIAVVAMAHPAVNEAVEFAMNQRVPVFTLLGGVTTSNCAGHFGLDGRKCGRIAAWTISRTAKKPGKIGILVGSHGYLHQDLSEISFRTYMREYAPEFQVLEPIINFEDDTIAHDAVRDLLETTPDLVGIYESGGGMTGLIEALREYRGDRQIVTVCNELTPTTRQALIDGYIDLALATPIEAISSNLIEKMKKASLAQDIAQLAPVLHAPTIHIRENI